MKNIFIKKLNTLMKKKEKGFVIPFSLLISTIILTISLGVSFILVKEIFFSKLNRDSLIAYYAADEALSCSMYVNDKYTFSDTDGTIYGLFPYSSSGDATNTLSNSNYRDNFGGMITPDKIVCNGSGIFNNVNSITQVGSSWKTDFNMKMDLGDGTQRCANVVVTVTGQTSSYDVRGYSSCDAKNRIERSLSR